jgi:hypothetical protein
MKLWYVSINCTEVCSVQILWLWTLKCAHFFVLYLQLGTSQIHIFLKLPAKMNKDTVHVRALQYLEQYKLVSGSNHNIISS